MMETCPESSRYERPLRAEDRLLGEGGCSESIERWRNTETGEWVAAKSVPFPVLAKREVDALRACNIHQIPRVIRLVEHIKQPPSKDILVLELPEGGTLYDYMDCIIESGKAESRMVATAAALMETLCKLHNSARAAHLDISPGNVMVTCNPVNEWDRLRVLDMGISQGFRPGAGNKVRAEAATCSCAAPEVLQSLQQLHQYGHWSMIDGAAADVWSSGVVLFQLLTGQEPFPRDIDKPFKSEWLRYSAARQAQYSWIKAVKVAEQTKTPISHPLLDKVRAWSDTPNAAVNFFCSVLNPSPKARLTSLQVLDHVYLKQCVHQMQDAYHPPPMYPLQSQASAQLHSLASAPLPSTPPTRRFFSSLASFQQGALSRLRSRFYKGTSAGSKLEPLSNYFPAYTHAQSDAELADAAPAVSDNLRAKFDHNMAELRSAKPTANDSPAAHIDASKSASTIQLHVTADATAAAAIQQQQEDLVSAADSPAESPREQQVNQSSSQQASASNVPEVASGLNSSTASPSISAAASSQQHQQTLFKRRPSPSLAYNAQHAATEASSSILAPNLMPNAPWRPLLTEPVAAVGKASLLGKVPAHPASVNTASSQEPRQATEEASALPTADAESTTVMPSSLESHSGAGQGQAQEPASPPAARASSSHLAGQSLPAADQDSTGSASSAGGPGSSAVIHHIGQPPATGTSVSAVNMPIALAHCGSAVGNASGLAQAADLPQSCRVDSAVTICSHPIGVLPEDEQEEFSSADLIKRVDIQVLRLLVLHGRDLALSRDDSDGAMALEGSLHSLARLANAAAFAGAPQAAAGQQRGIPYVSSDIVPVVEPKCQVPPVYRAELTGSRDCKTGWLQRSRKALGKLGRAYALAGAAAGAALWLASPSRS